MRNLVLASIVALTASVSFGAAAQAAGVTVTIGDRDHHRHPQVVHRVFRDHHRRGRDCFTKKVVTHRHGRRMVEKTKVCR